MIKSEVTFNPNDSTNSRIVIINPDAKTQPILYNLDAIISVGYRVNSKQATHFRRWATSVLKEYKEFRIYQDRNYESDFDNLIKSIKRLEGKK